MGKKQAFFAFTKTRVFSIVSNFFGWNSSAIFLKVLLSVRNSAWLSTHFEFYQQHFL